ncbi:hypothetical protein [Photobacterium leiognathi]|uniref:hypothetical protein n=1 Tax=Photobacterium leiognathi TaxID=553611 RepID=UPI002981902C|nr:hypothetical protein [Photobacterium leiognathi]
MNIIENLIVAILGGLAAFLLNFVKDKKTEQTSKTVSIHYLAIIITASLERFITDSMSVVYDNGRCDKDGYRYTTVSTPTFSPLEYDVEWKALNHELLYDIFIFSQLITDVDNNIAAVYEYSSMPPDFESFYDARIAHYAALGLIAIDLVERLRKVGNLPKNGYELIDTKNIFLSKIKDSEMTTVDRITSRVKLIEKVMNK